MNKLLKTTLLSAFCLVLLAGCGKKDENTNDPQETANVGNLLDNMGPESADCPDNYEPVCTTEGQITYKNACHAEKAGEDAWQPGEC